MSAQVFKSERGRAAILGLYRELLDHAPVPIETRRVSTEGGETYVVEAGAPDAPPVVLLHGTGSNAASWLGDVPRWAEQSRVIAADMPGEPGLSEPRRMRLAGWLQSP